MIAPNKETLQLLQGNQYGDLSTVFKNQCEEVFSYAMTAETQQLETTKGTIFGAYNAITGYFQNVRSYKDEEAKLKSLVYVGTAANKAQKALDLCSAFAEHGKEAILLNQSKSIQNRQPSKGGCLKYNCHDKDGTKTTINKLYNESNRFKRLHIESHKFG